MAHVELASKMLHEGAQLVHLIRSSRDSHTHTRMHRITPILTPHRSTLRAIFCALSNQLQRSARRHASRCVVLPPRYLLSLDPYSSVADIPQSPRLAQLDMLLALSRCVDPSL